MIEFDPILNSQDLTGVSILPEWPKTRDGVAIVLIDNTGELFSLKLGEQASFDEILLSNLDRYFLVDTSQHVFSFISDLPLSFRAYSLEAAINCTGLTQASSEPQVNEVVDVSNLKRVRV